MYMVLVSRSLAAMDLKEDINVTKEEADDIDRALRDQIKMAGNVLFFIHSSFIYFFLSSIHHPITTSADFTN